MSELPAVHLTAPVWNVGDFWQDQNRAEFVCTVAGTPGTWRQIAPATVTADPASGPFPVRYLIVIVADCGFKRHAGGLSSEIALRARASAKVGFHGAAPTPHRSNPAKPPPPTSPASSPSPMSRGAR